MTFKVTMRRDPLGVEFEAGSVSEALSILQESKDKFAELLDLAVEFNGDLDADAPTAAAPAAPEKPATRRGRKPKNHSDPATASAPAPAPVPAAPVADGIPPILDRSNPDCVVNAPVASAPAAAAPVASAPAPAAPASSAPAPAAPPPPPVLPAAPPTAPNAAPPAGVNGPKVVEALRIRANGQPDGGASLVAWLAAPGIGLVAAGVSFEEAMSVLLLTSDDRLAPIMAPLGIA